MKKKYCSDRQQQQRQVQYHFNFFFVGIIIDNEQKLYIKYLHDVLTHAGKKKRYTRARTKKFLPFLLRTATGTTSVETIVLQDKQIKRKEEENIYIFSFQLFLFLLIRLFPYYYYFCCRFLILECLFPIRSFIYCFFYHQSFYFYC